MTNYQEGVVVFDGKEVVVKFNRQEFLTQAQDPDPNPNHKLPPAVRRAIDATLPGSPGYRNRLLLQFARLLKGLPELSNPAQLEPYVREWHRLALPAIVTKEFDVTWRDFLIAWDNVRFPAGEGPLAEIYACALSRMPAIAHQFKVAGVRNLVALCCELQLQAGDSRFGWRADLQVPCWAAHPQQPIAGFGS
jgi:hypothetical protein